MQRAGKQERSAKGGTEDREDAEGRREKTCTKCIKL